MAHTAKHKSKMEHGVFSCLGLMLLPILWRHHCQYQCGTADSSYRCGWANPGRVKKQEMPRAEEMHVVIKAKDFNQHVDASIPNSLALGVE